VLEQSDLLAIRRIASKANPKIKAWASLADKPARRALGLTLAEGRRLVADALARGRDSRFEPRAFLVSDAGAAHAEAGGLFEMARGLGIECFSLSDPCYEKISRLGAPEGIALVCGLPAREDLVALAAEGIWLVADGVQDPGNAGALARTALAAGAAGCLFLDGVDPTSPKFLRGSMGAAFALACPAIAAGEFVRLRPSLPLRLVAAVSGNGAVDYRLLDRRPPLGIVVGGEKGISDNILDLADERIHIPLQGGVESLNLAVAAGVLLFSGETGGAP
jgi:TrmH family RNA methyltransferase